ncbi:MAG: hypothetical protein JNG90_17380 [Planctomycetaceae bacterium]|nr:hypothetical protein [Planctomycetaceae bacterium]
MAARCLAVTLWMSLALVPVAWIGYSLHGSTGLLAAVFAALICLAGALPPVLAAHRWRGPEYALHHVLLGMVSRMVLPLVLGMVIQFQRGPLSQSGFLLNLVAFFLVGLAFDTLCLVVASTGSSRAAPRLG